VGRATYSVERRDALDAARWGPVDDAKCFVVALEVLDNLPHDRVLLLRDDASNSGNETRLAQTRVFARRRGEDNAVDGFEQREEPLRDPLIARALEAIGDDESFFAFGFDVRAMADRWIRGARDWNARFVPTGALALLETLHERRPRHRLVAADFDSLPNVRVPVRRFRLAIILFGFSIWLSFGFHSVLPSSADLAPSLPIRTGNQRASRRDAIPRRPHGGPSHVPRRRRRVRRVLPDQLRAPGSTGRVRAIEGAANGRGVETARKRLVASSEALGGDRHHARVHAQARGPRRDRHRQRLQPPDAGLCKHQIFPQLIW